MKTLKQTSTAAVLIKEMSLKNSLLPIGSWGADRALGVQKNVKPVGFLQKTQVSCPCVDREVNTLSLITYGCIVKDYLLTCIATVKGYDTSEEAHAICAMLKSLNETIEEQCKILGYAPATSRVTKNSTGWLKAVGEKIAKLQESIESAPPAPKQEAVMDYKF